MSSLLVRFRKKLEQLVGDPPTPHFLLAISGGLDSMVLWDLFQECDLSFSVAHCNFQLRGAASDDDEAFVEGQALKTGVPYFCKRFATKKFASKHKMGTQEAARVLRYEWLETIRQKQGVPFVVTAHHADDNLETFLLNFTKGAGLKGLLGIPEKNGCIIRPLLTFPRAELEQHYDYHKLKHREDSSNQEDLYQRNKLRHHVVPVLKAINPSIGYSMTKNLDVLKEVYILFQEQVAAYKREVWQEDQSQVRINLSPILEHPGLSTLLYEWLKVYDFHPDQIRQLVGCIQEQQVGAQFFSEQYQLLLDRAALLLKKRSTEQNDRIYIKEHHQSVFLPEGELHLHYQSGQPSAFSEHPYEVFLDAEALKFPLEVRHWQAGDRFSPLGMPGQHKKVQDLFSDRKINRFQKEKIWIVTDADQRICWIIGLQMDDRFKIHSGTQAFIRLLFKDTQKS